MTKRKNEEDIHQQAFNKKTKIIRFELSFTIHSGKLKKKPDHLSKYENTFKDKTS
jgi:hypothetical protein